jgi:TP901 family phage tail tape measure protein
MAFGTDRSVSVKIKADVTDYISNTKKASKATEEFGKSGKTASDQHKAAWDGVGTSATKAKKSTEDLGKSVGATKQQTKDLGIGMAAAGAAMAAGIGLAVKAFADFDQAMSEVRAVSGATAGEMDQLTQAALDAGAATKFSAAEAAGAQAELAKAGISTADILGGALTGTLSLAAAGTLELATAAEVAANAMNIFNLQGEDVEHIADVLAAGANKSATDVNELGQALQQSGLVAAQAGLSLEETTGILAAFADNGLKGSDAGTSLKTALQRLVPSSAAAASAMKDIGFSAFDAQGNMKSISVVAEDLRTGLSGLTQEQQAATLSTIFGSDAVRAANVLYKLGGQGVREYTTAVNDQGAAADTAAIKMDNLAGDMENLRGSIETGLIKAGSGANDTLRSLTQAATNAVNAFGDLPDSVQSSVVGIAAVTSGVLLLGGALITTIPKIVATKAAMDALALSAPKTAAAVGLLTKAVAVVAVADIATQIRGWAAAAQVGEPPVKELADSLLKVAENGEESGKFGELFARGMGPFRQGFEGASDAINDFGSNAKAALDPEWYETAVGTAAEAATMFEKRTKQIDEALVDLVNSGHADQAAKLVDRLAESTVQYGGDSQKVRDSFTGYKAIVEGAAVANGQYAGSVDGVKSATSGALGPGRLLADEIKEQKDAAQDAKDEYDKLTTAVKNYGDQVATALSASAGFEAAIDAAAEVATNRAEAAAAVAKFDADAAAERTRLKAEIAKAKTPEDKKRLEDQLGKVGDPKERERLVKATEQYAKTLDITTEAGRKNQRMLLDIASTAKDSAVENFKNGTSVEDVQKKMEGARGAFVKQAQDFGLSEDAAKKLADQLGLTRGNVEQLAKLPPAEVEVKANTADADAAIAATSALLDRTDGKTASTYVEGDNSHAKAVITETDGLLDMIDGRVVVAKIETFVSTQMSADVQTQIAMLSGTLAQRAAGGIVRGSGTSTSDSIHTLLSDGEYVVKTAAVEKYGTHFLDSVNGMRFADGGFVSSTMSTTTNSGGNVTNDRRIHIDQVVASDFASFEREAERRRRVDSLGTRRVR